VLKIGSDAAADGEEGRAARRKSLAEPRQIGAAEERISKGDEKGIWRIW
jgi:hypothetical protein